MILLAKINHLNVPIRKESNLALKEISKMLDFAYANCFIKEIAEECSYQTLQTYDVREEYHELMQLIEELNAPVVLCHHDFRGCNILVTEDSKSCQNLLGNFLIITSEIIQNFALNLFYFA